MSNASATAAGARLDGEGWGLLVDRSRPVSFTFDGKPQQGFVGDVIASALMASAARSCRARSSTIAPRGALTMAGHDVNAMVQVGPEPNVRGDRHPIAEGMTVVSVNRLGIAGRRQVRRDRPVLALSAGRLLLQDLLPPERRLEMLREADPRARRARQARPRGASRPLRQALPLLRRAGRRRRAGRP